MTEWSSWFAHSQLGLPTQTATVGNRYLMVVRVGDEWHWLAWTLHTRRSLPVLVSASPLSSSATVVDVISPKASPMALSKPVARPRPLQHRRMTDRILRSH